MAAAMTLITAACALLTAAFAVLHRLFPAVWLLSAAITCGTFLYHFAMRLAVGHAVNAVMGNRADYTRPRYRPLPFEEKLYKKLKVRLWKDRLPTYMPAYFDIKNKSLEDILQAMCQAETVHLIILPLSFLPLLAAIPFGALPVFLITSMAAAAIDLAYVILQRYNRPRLLKVLQRQNKKS